MTKIFVVVISIFLVSSCGQISNTLKQSLDINNFTRQDAIRVFNCALTKENATEQRFSLETQLALNKSLSDENWNKLVNLNKQNAFDGVNNIAKKYSCF